MNDNLFPIPTITDYDAQQVAEILKNPSFQKYIRMLAHKAMMDHYMFQAGNREDVFSAELARARLSGSIDVYSTFLPQSGQ